MHEGNRKSIQNFALRM